MGFELDNKAFRVMCGSALATPWNWRDFPKDGGFGFEYRSDHIIKYGFAVLNEAALEALLPLSPLLEVGAGAGYWAYELARAGADIVTTDPFPPGLEMDGRRNHYKFGSCWRDIEPLDAVTAIRKYPGRNLLTIWPGYTENWTHTMLRAFEGEYVAYVGEGSGGCTGSYEFHDYLSRKFDEVETVAIPQFFGIHDYLAIYKRKKRHPRKGMPLETSRMTRPPIMPVSE